MEPLDLPTSPAPSDEPKSAFRPNKLTSGIVAGGAAFAMVLAGLGIANAQTSDSGSSDTPSAATPAPDGDGGHHHRPRAVIEAGLDVAASTLGISEADLRTQLQSGKSIADVAGEKTDAVIAAMVKAAEDHLAADVAAGKLTQAEADQRKANLTERVTTFVNTVPPARGDGDGPGHPGRPDLHADAAIVATTIGITPAELRTQLESGKSIAAIAGEKTDAVIKALVADREAELAKAVSDGKLTQAQADERKANLTERITALVNRTPPADGDRPGPGPGRDGDHPRLATVAGVLGISESDLRTQLESGKTLAAIAGDKTGAVVDALVKEAQAHLDQAVTDGKITQAQADERKANLQARITEMANHAGPPAGGPHRGGHDRDGDGPDSDDGPPPAPAPAQPESQPASVTA
jgi:ribosomal protein S20